MAVSGHEPADSVESQSVAESGNDVVGIIPAPHFAVQRQLALLDRLDIRRRKPEAIRAEFDLQFPQGCGELLDDGERVVARICETDCQRVLFRVDASHGKAETPTSAVRVLQPLAHGVRQPSQCILHIFRQAYGFGQCHARRVCSPRALQPERVGSAAQGAGERIGRLDAETAGDFSGLDGVELADGPNAGAGQVGDKAHRQVERVQRQFFQRLKRASRLDDADPATAEPREGPCGPFRVGDADRRSYPHAFQPEPRMFGHGLLASEQMGAAADVEQQPVRRIESDPRGQKIRPVPQGAQQRRFPGFVGGLDRKIRADRASVGQRKAGVQPVFPRDLVDVGQDPGAFESGGDGEGSRQARVAAPRQPIKRQLRKPNG